MMASLKAFAASITTAIKQRKTAALLERLQLKDDIAASAAFEARGGQSMQQLQTIFGDRLQKVEPAAKWAKCLAHHLLCLKHLQAGQPLEAHGEYLKAAAAFREVFDKEDSSWLDRPMVQVCKNLRAVADVAHRAQRQQGLHSEVMNLTGEEIRRALKNANQAQKGPAVLPIIVVLYKLYFKIGNMRLSKELASMVQNQYPVSSYPLGEQVAYLFFNGVLKVMEESWTEAQKNLTRAFRCCHPSSPQNKRAILSYLVPVRMLLGYMPRASALERYNLSYFEPIVDAVRLGDPVALRAALDANQYRFIQAGTYLVMEKLYLTAFRMLVKRTLIVHRQLEPDNAKLKNQVFLTAVQTALAALGEDMDLDEVECIVANLICKKYIKGYISHAHRRLVIDKKNPFPALDTVQLS